MNKRGWWIFGAKKSVGNKRVKNRAAYIQIVNNNLNNALVSLNHLNENSTHLVDYGGTRDDAVLFKSKVNSAINALKEINKLLEYFFFLFLYYLYLNIVINIKQ